MSKAKALTLTKDSPAIKTLLGMIIGTPRIRGYAHNKRIIGEVNLSDPATMAFMKKSLFEHNRKFSQRNSDVLDYAIAHDDLSATNVLGMAYDFNKLDLINGNHTIIALIKHVQNGGVISDPFYTVTVWIEPEGWNTASGLGFNITMYSRYDAGKTKTQIDQLNAYEMHTKLGIQKGELKRMNSVITAMFGDGRNKVNEDEYSRLKTIEGRVTELVNANTQEHAFLKTQFGFDTSSASNEVKKRIKTVLNFPPFAAAYFKAHAGFTAQNDVSSIALMDELYCDIASGNFSNKTAKLLVNFKTDSDESDLYKLASNSAMHRPYFVAVLYCLMHFIHDEAITMDDLNRTVETGIGKTPKASIIVSFGDYDCELTGKYFKNTTPTASPTATKTKIMAI